MEGKKSAVEEVYRNNHKYIQLPRGQKEQISYLIKALKKSKVVKVCKDKFNIKRRLPFKLNEDIKKHIEDATLYIENFPQSIDLHDLFKPYGVRDCRIRAKNDVQYALVEVNSKEAALKAQQDLNNTVPALFRLVKDQIIEHPLFILTKKQYD